jgi:hypothetical protein
MPRSLWVGCLVLLTLWAAPAKADFVISMSSTSIAQGGTGTLDVYLTSNASSLSPDLLNDFGFTLQITGTNELQFASTQSFNYLSSSHYAFGADSDDLATTSPGGTVSTSNTGYANDTFSGNDSTFSGDPVALSSANTPVLLASLTLDATITAAGDSYSINLLPSSGIGSIFGSTDAYFDDLDFNPTSPTYGDELAHTPFSSTPFTLTITAATVPEPASILSGLAATLIGAASFSLREPRRTK